MTIPNILTLFRLILVPLVVMAIAQGDHAWAFYGFVIAGITDGLDGFIARHFNQRSQLGAYLDPLADKALLVSIYVTLAIVGDIPRWLAILVVARDLMIIGGVMLSWLMGRPVEIEPLFISKANTAAQIVFAALVLAAQGLFTNLHDIIRIGLYIVASLTTLSALAYCYQWLKHMSVPTDHAPPAP